MKHHSNIRIGDWVGSGWQVIGLSDTHLTARHRLDDLSSAARPVIELFELRVGQLADQVKVGRLGFIDAIDMAYSAAQWSGLVDSVGADAVQKILADCFGGIAKGESKKEKNNG